MRSAKLGSFGLKRRESSATVLQQSQKVVFPTQSGEKNTRGFPVLQDWLPLVSNNRI
jgi:hypothetical protein